MAGLDPAIHALLRGQNMDTRVNPAHDEKEKKASDNRPLPD